MAFMYHTKSIGALLMAFMYQTKTIEALLMVIMYTLVSNLEFDQPFF